MPAEGRARIALIVPDGNTVPVAEMPIDLTKVERTRHRIYWQELRLTAAGRYVFWVELLEDDQDAWRPVASVPVRVVLMTPKDG